jgi:hypothetical protein
VKKLLGIVAVVALMAVPAMAVDVPVMIHVSPYCGIVTAPGTLTMTVNDVYHTGVALSEGLHQATTLFSVQGNQAFNVTLTAPYISNGSGPFLPGQTANGYPTAYIGGTPNGTGTNGIGFGVTILNLTNNTNAGWAAPAASTALQFPAGASNGQIRINTYIDSGRSNLVMLDGGKMAEPGDYATTLVMTVSVQ